MLLKDKVAIITGGASGIGSGIVEKFVREGAKVVIADLNLEAAEELANKLKGEEGSAKGYKIDITDYEATCKMVQDVINDFGQLDILVNNAGWDKIEPFLKSEPETWEKIININLKGTINCCHASWEYFLNRKEGKIVNIASDAGRAGSSGETVYSSTKGGLIALTKSLAREGARSTINVNCVCPGPADTELFKQLSDDNPKLGESLIKAIPFRRLAQPSDIASAVAFFSSDEASYITGQTISVSGGLTMM